MARKNLGKVVSTINGLNTVNLLGSSPVVLNTSGNTITVSVNMATSSNPGLMSSSDKAKLDAIPADVTSNIGTITEIQMNGATVSTSGVANLGTVITEHQDISGKVDKVNGKGLSTNDFTDGYKALVDSALQTHQDISGKVDKVTGKQLSTNDFTDAYKNKVDDVYSTIGNKVDKVNGKQLSTNDFTNEYKALVDSALQEHQDISGKVDVTKVGVANGVAELDNSGKVPASQLPAFVDDVLEFATTAAFPQTGETGKIYVATGTNLTYRWSGTGYVEISQSLALGETSTTAYRGDRGATAYNHTFVTTGNPHRVTKADVGLENVDNTSDANKPISTATQAALDAKVPNTRKINNHNLSADVTLTKTDVGLSQVDNTSDLNKPISTATQTALNGKVDKVTGKVLSSNDYTDAEKETNADNAAAIVSHEELISNIYSNLTRAFVSYYVTGSGNMTLNTVFPSKINSIQMDASYANKSVFLQYCTDVTKKSEDPKTSILSELPVYGQANKLYLIPLPAGNADIYKKYKWDVPTGTYTDLGNMTPDGAMFKASQSASTFADISASDIIVTKSLPGTPNESKYYLEYQTSAGSPNCFKLYKGSTFRQAVYLTLSDSQIVSMAEAEGLEEQYFQVGDYKYRNFTVAADGSIDFELYVPAGRQAAIYIAEGSLNDSTFKSLLKDGFKCKPTVFYYKITEYPSPISKAFESVETYDQQQQATLMGYSLDYSQIAASEVSAREEAGYSINVLKDSKYHEVVSLTQTTLSSISSGPYYIGTYRKLSS